MKIKTKIISTAILTPLIMISSQLIASGSTPWAYSGHSGPEYWGELDKSFSTCATGVNQSPINLTKMVKGNLPTLKVNYSISGNEVLNNGHTIQVNYAAGSTMTVGQRTFELKQFHFHSPSENTIESTSYPLEAHFVHADENGNLAVIAVMFKSGPRNLELAKAWQQMPENAGGKNTLSSVVDGNMILPVGRDYYRFNGSLTTPPCSEGVNWFVMKSFATASDEQINKFKHTLHHDNNRPVQPINAREIIQ